MVQKLKSEEGFTTLDTAIALVIISISLILIANIIYNSYLQVLSTHRNAMATFYAVEILEKIQKLDYNDLYLKHGERTIEEIPNEDVNKILDIPIEKTYTANLKVEDYNKLAGNENKEDILKIVEVTVGYIENDINKNITIKTLKYDM